jgi:Zn-dependent protease
MTSSDAIIGTNNKNNNAEEIAKQLRQRAQELRREAMSEEQSLKKSVELKKEQEKREADNWIDLLLGRKSDELTVVESSVANFAVSSTPSAQTLALRMKEYNLISPAKLMKIAERLHERETSMLIGPEALLSKPETVGTSGDFILGDYENNSLERKADENERITGLLDGLLDAVQLIDEDGSKTKLAPSLRIRVTELRQNREALLKRRVDGLLQSGRVMEGGKSLDDLVRSSMDGDVGYNDQSEKQRQEKMIKRLIETPSWLPSSLVPFAATSPVEVPITTWKMIKSDLLANSDFICTSWDATDVAAIFRGRISRKAVDADDSDNQITKVFNNLLKKLEYHPELKNKVQLFLVDDFEWRPAINNGLNINEDMSPPPVIIAVAKEVAPEQESERGLGIKALAAFSTLTTILTTFAYALSSFALNPGFFNAVVNENDVTLVPICLPIFLGSIAMTALHELGHYAAARKYNITMGSPVPLPSFQVGSFGCITPFRSFPSSRTAMYDVAMSGPGLTLIISILLIIAGLSLTTTATSFSAYPLVPAAVMKSSFLLGSIASILAPKSMLVPLSQPIPVHPLLMIGLAGLIMSAVNLLPIGRLDGGRALMAAFGRRTASVISLLTLLTMAFCSFTGSSGVVIFWGAIVVMTQRLPDIPAVDEVTAVNRLRSNCYIIFLMLGEFCFVTMI